MLVAFASDPHVSHYGGHMGLLRGGRRRIAGQPDKWSTVWAEDGWRIERRNRLGFFGRGRALRLIDDAGELHAVRSVSNGADTEPLLGELRALQRERLLTDEERLADGFPSGDALRQHLRVDPSNYNLRFCAAAHALDELDPDWVVITGDLTDDAVGYQLILAGLRRFVDRRRLVCVAGNHDVYPTPPLWTPRALRRTEAEKRKAWSAFADALDQPSTGGFVRDLGDGVALACMDSCYPPRSPGSASGMVPLRQLHELAEDLDRLGADTRLACLHHHVINPPPLGVGRAPLQAGMRLRNADRVLPALADLRLTAVFNGHRHVGYQFKPAGRPLFVSLPSMTFGCRTGCDPYFVVADVGRDGLRSLREHPVALLRGLSKARVVEDDARSAR